MGFSVREADANEILGIEFSVAAGCVTVGMKRGKHIDEVLFEKFYDPIVFGMGAITGNAPKRARQCPGEQGTRHIRTNCKLTYWR